MYRHIRYSYSQTRGLFGGVSVEGSVIIERQDANALAYGAAVTCRMLLNGTVPVPPWAEDLHRVLQSCTRLPGGRTWIADTPQPGWSGYAFGSAAVSSPESRKKRSTVLFPPAAWGKRKDSGSFFETTDQNLSNPSNIDHLSSSKKTNNRYTMFDSPGGGPNHRRWSTADQQDGIKPSKNDIPSDTIVAKAVAEYDFQALEVWGFDNLYY